MAEAKEKGSGGGAKKEKAREARVLSAFEALSSEVRLAIFRLLVAHEPDGLVAGEISDALRIPPTNLSFHLKVLAHAGLVEGESRGRFVRYRARIRAVEEVVSYLTENCCQASSSGVCSSESIGG